jgi:hypothetical protein
MTCPMRRSTASMREYAERWRASQEISERYHYEPPKVWVERQTRPKVGLWSRPPGCASNCSGRRWI